jgi:hypothetical protein
MKLLPTSHLAHSSHIIFNIPNKIKYTKKSWLNNNYTINLLAYISLWKKINKNKNIYTHTTKLLFQQQQN